MVCCALQYSPLASLLTTASCCVVALCREYMANVFGLDVNLFGITDEGGKQYVNYLYTEGYKHGSNHVNSMVHHFLKTNTVIGNAQRLVIYTDSCGGQNRNQFVMFYLVQRVLQGYHDVIHWRFMSVGHSMYAAACVGGWMRVGGSCGMRPRALWRDALY